ncbi:MAG: glycosyltransferase family 2 protein [Vicinamibacterales bacterium]
MSVVIPCRNEAAYITGCLDSITKGDYPVDRLEILVVDGLSDDETPDLVRDYARNRPHIRLLSNHKRVTPAALNMGIAEARGAVIVRIDAHARVAPDYVRQCISALRQYRAANVGGVMHTIPSRDTPSSRAIAISISHPFGVGNSVFRTHRSEPCQVDTVFGGCYPRQVFEHVGRYNEQLVRGQDMEFNLRLRRAGGRIMFVPEIVSHYFARTSYTAFARHNWANGIWAVRPFALSDIVPVRPRHLVPLAFVLTLIGMLALSALTPLVRPVTMALVVVYGLACVTASCVAGWQRRDLAAVPLLPIMFATLHLGYGAGSLVGVVQLFHAQLWRRLGRGPKDRQPSLQPERR